MAVQLSLDRCGVVLVGRSQGGTARGPQLQRGPTNATDCGSDPLLMAGGGQSRATGHQTLRIVDWNAEGVRQKKLELQQFLKAQKKLMSAASRRPISTTRTDSPSGDMRYTGLTEQTDSKLECLHLLKPAYHPQRSRDQRKLTRNTSPSNSFSHTETWPSVTSTVRPTKQSNSKFFNQTAKTGWL